MKSNDLDKVNGNKSDDIHGKTNEVVAQELKESVNYTETNEPQDIKHSQQPREQKYKTLFNSKDEGFCLIDVKFDENNCPIDAFCVDANVVATNMLGKNYIGKYLTELCPNFDTYYLEMFF